MKKLFERYLQVEKEINVLDPFDKLWKEENELEKKILKILRKEMRDRGIKIPKSISVTIGDYRISDRVKAPGIDGYNIKVKKIK